MRAAAGAASGMDNVEVTKMGTASELPEVAVLRRQSSRHTARMADAQRGVAAGAP